MGTTTEMFRTFSHLMMNLDLKNNHVFLANLFVLILNVIFIFISGKLNSINLLFGFLFYQLFFLLIPGIFYLKYKKLNLLSSIKFNMISLDMVLYSITVVIFAYPLIAIISYLLNRETILIGQNFSYDFIQNISIGGFIIIILTYAVIPAICEEFFFRGILNKVFEKYSLLICIITISLIFAIMHYSIKNFIGPFLLSVFLMYICERSDSIIPAVIGHFVYNFMGLSVVLLFYTLSKGNFNYIPKPDLQVFSIVIIIIAILLVYPVYKIIDIIESKHRLKVKIRENSNEILGQISILDYYGKNITYNYYVSLIEEFVSFSPILILFIIYTLISFGMK